MPPHRPPVVMLSAEMKSFLKSLTKLNPFFAGSKWLSSAAVLGGNGWGLSETLLPGLETGAPAPLSARWLGTEDPLLPAFDTGALACATFPPGLPDSAAAPGGSGCGLTA